MQVITKKEINKGILLAVLACLIWSGNFIAARGVAHAIPPITLSIFRWLTASIVILPLAWKTLRTDLRIARQHKLFFLITAATGVSMFNTFVYVAAKYTSAINLALIGTTASPVMAILLARIVLKEPISGLRITGLVICITGILFLLGEGSIQNILTLTFTAGDLWIMAAALSFAVYNTMVKKRPKGISSTGFLAISFVAGTLLLLPGFIIEQQDSTPLQLNSNLLLIIAYLGIGTSVIAFICWNAAIARLGAARTALYGNLIPIFSSIEAVLLLNEAFTWVHLVSFLLVVAGLVISNMTGKRS